MLINLGFLQQGEGKRAEALKTYTRARDIATGLVAVPSPVPAHRLQLARSCLMRGTLLVMAEQYKEAVADLSESIVQLQSILKPAPRDATARQSLSRASYNRATALGRLKRHRDALADWDRAVELAEPKARAGYRLRRADCLARAGQPAKAFREAQALAKTSPPGWVWYALGSIAANSSAVALRDTTRPLPWRERFAEQAARQAVVWLYKAHKAGVFKVAANAAHLKVDPDLDSLRQRDDFKAFVKQLASP